MSGKLIGPAFEAQLIDGIRRDRQSFHSHDATPVEQKRRPSAFSTYRIILDVTVPAAADPLAVVEGSIDPGKPNATVLQWSARRKRYVQTTKRIAVANTSDTEYPVDNAAWAIPQAGHYELAGCPQAVTSRPDPPWLEELQTEGPEGPPEEPPV